MQAANSCTQPAWHAKTTRTARLLHRRGKLWAARVSANASSYGCVNIVLLRWHMQGLHHERVQLDRGPGDHGDHGCGGLWRHPSRRRKLVRSFHAQEDTSLSSSVHVKHTLTSGPEKLLVHAFCPAKKQSSHGSALLVLMVPTSRGTFLLSEAVVSGLGICASCRGVHCIVPKWMFNMSDTTPYRPLTVSGTSKPANVTMLTTL